MRHYYADSSVLMKCYVHEGGSRFMVRLVADPNNWVFCSAIGEVEVVSALTRRCYGDGLAPPLVDAKVAEARADFERRYHVVEVTPDLLSRACAVARSSRLRGYDAVHLTAALSVHAGLDVHTRAGLTVVSSDSALNAVARAEGLDVVDPSVEA